MSSSAWPRMNPSQANASVTDEALACHYSVSLFNFSNARNPMQSPAEAYFAALNEIRATGGGVNEVQRDLIALFGLGMPRVPRH